MGDVRHELAVGAVVRLVLVPIGTGNDVRRMSEPVSDHGALLAHRGAALSPVFSDHVCEFGHGRVCRSPRTVPDMVAERPSAFRCRQSLPMWAYSHNHPALGVPSEILKSKALVARFVEVVSRSQR